MKEIDVSIIIVNYKVQDELLLCIQSILKSHTKSSYEIIVVDNDEHKSLKQPLKKAFSKVIYIPNKNKGFGQGCNTGEKYAKGNFLFFLNPDTQIQNNSIDVLVSYLRIHRSVGIVAPVLLDSQNYPLSFQGLGVLTPSNAFFSLSFLNKILPNNSMSRAYWNKDWDYKKPKKVGQVPGTAFLIRHDLFTKLQGFDEHFFLFFEENDLCKRAIGNGWEIVINPLSRVYHLWGQSTKQSSKDINQIFIQSRRYYFKKHFGIAKTFLLELFLSINKNSLLITAIFCIALTLRIYKLQVLMPFIGDQAWFYISARNMLLYKQIPLVGITASHTWLHQGALFTYILSIVLYLFRFNPLAPGYVFATLDVLTLYLVHRFAKQYVSLTAGVIAALLYAVSPLVVTAGRMPYHTSLIPLAMITFLFLLAKWLKGNISFFPLVIASLAILYNFELATAEMWLIPLALIVFGVKTRKKWALGLFTKKTAILSFFGWVIPMFPMIVYDTTHGFPQTIKFFVWFIYKIVSALIPHHSHIQLSPFFAFTISQFQLLLFAQNALVATAILSGISIISLYYLFQSIKKETFDTKGIVSIAFLVGFIGYLVAQTNSAAYFPMLFVPVVLLLASILESCFSNKIGKTLVAIALCAYVLTNVYALLSNNYYMGKGFAPTFQNRLVIAKEIVKEAGDQRYTIKGEGNGSQFSSFVMDYQYVTWWLGRPVQNDPSIIFVVSEKNGTITLRSIHS